MTSQDVRPIDALLVDPGVDADDYVETLNRKLGLSGRLITEAAHDEMLDVVTASAALRSGVARLPGTGDVIAIPRYRALRGLLGLLRGQENICRRTRLVTPQAFSATILRVCGASLACFIARGPAAIDPVYSAADLGRIRFAGLALIGAMVCGTAASVAGVSWLLAPFMLAFLGLTMLRLWALLTLRPFTGAPSLPDWRLPHYTVLVPLYREARALPGLLKALQALDYPTAKLDIKLLVEASDQETRRALAMHRLPAHMEQLEVPDGFPRTKPRALNLGLAATRGDLVVIYDAEDRPEHAQLREAAAMFAISGDDLACVQARLATDNTSDNWITRAFTMEYAGLFEVFLPALSARGYLVPLGGTSNHFRANLLRRVGAWDAFNVTEDADLGVRLARFGYRTATINSRTYEEAPNTYMGWLKQRTRWMKGYVVTWLVHMRRPVRLWHELGWRNFLVFQAVIGGVPLAALAQAVCLTVMGWQLATGTLFEGSSITDALIVGGHAGLLVFGYTVAAALAWVGLRQQGVPRLIPLLFMLVPYWLMVAVACYRALVQLAVSPYGWEKTAHGLGRSSRRGDLIAGDAPHRRPRRPACPD